MVKHKAQTGWLWEAAPGGKPECLEGGAGQIDDGMGEKEGDNMKEHWKLNRRGTGSEMNCCAACRLLLLAFLPKVWSVSQKLRFLGERAESWRPSCMVKVL